MRISRYTTGKRFGSCGMIASLLALTFFTYPKTVRAEFPNFKTLSGTNVAIKVVGFRFAGGLRRNSRGKFNGKGTEILRTSWCGSGFLIKSDGTIATNYHVASRMMNAKAIFDGGATYDISHIRVYSRRPDLALLKIRTREKMPTVSLGDSDKVQVMEKVLAVGNGKCRGVAVTDGIINQLIRDRNEKLSTIRHSAPIAPGNSGGALYRGKEVVGVNTRGLALYTIWYAEPINEVKRLLKKYGNRTIHVQDAFPTNLKRIVRKFQTRLAKTGRVPARRGKGASLRMYKMRLNSLTDYGFFLNGERGADLDLMIISGKKIIGYSTTRRKRSELLLLSNQYPRNATVAVMNYHHRPVNFGLKVYRVRW